ncbi:hypothetical protein AHAS_Ahas11G0271900 [Arachis hypogaea]
MEKSIVVPPIATNNFELKPQLVTLVQQNCQYHGLPHEDPNQFISDFLQICDTVKTNGVNPEVYRLILFPFALRDKAKLWLDSQPKESLNTWKKVVTEFLTKFFPPKKLTKLRLEVQTFRQNDGETLYEAWERYKLLTRQCPPDMFSKWTQLDIFYEDLGEISKMSLDTSAGGSLHKKKTPEETIELIELVASNQYLYSSNRNPVNSETSQKRCVLEVEAVNALLAQNKLMSQQINLLTQQMGGMQVSAINTQNPPQEVSYDMAGNFVQNNNYDYAQFSSEQVNYMESAFRNSNNDPYSQTYNQGWRNHPNFGWRDQPQKLQNFNNNFQGGFQQNNYNNCQFQSQQQQPPQQANSKSQEDSNWKMMRSFVQETRASIKNLEIQMGQIATRINEIDQRTTNSLSSNTIPNPREECKAITLISGQVATGSETTVNGELVEKEAPVEKKEEVEHVPPKCADNPFSDSLDTYPTLPKAPEYKPKMPYPQRLQKETKDK